LCLRFKASFLPCHNQLPVYCIETAPYTLPPPPSASIGDCRVMFVTTAQVQGDFSGQLQIGQSGPAFIAADKACDAAFQTDGNDIVKSRASVGYSVWLSAGVCSFFLFCFFLFRFIFFFLIYSYNIAGRQNPPQFDFGLVFRTCRRHAVGQQSHRFVV